MRVGLTRTLLYEEVVSELYKMIDREQIKLGEKFPSERELVQRWDISRNVLREAFHILEERGIIISRQGKGRYLRALPEIEYNHKYDSLTKNLERYSLLEIYEVRIALECKVVEQVIKYASDEDIEEIEDFYKELADKFKATNSTIGEFDMHRLYSKKSKNNFLDQLINITFKSNLDIMTSTFHDVLIEHSAKESIDSHKRIIDAIKNRDTDKAKEEMRMHIQNTIDMIT